MTEEQKKRLEEAKILYKIERIPHIQETLFTTTQKNWEFLLTLIDEQAADNQRLREALERIVDGRGLTFEYAQEIAKAALEGKDG